MAKPPKPRKTLRPPSTAEYIDRLRRDFSAELAIRLSHPATPDLSRLKSKRLKVSAKLYNQFRDEPWDVEFYEWSAKSPRLTVVWERPTTSDTPARALVRRLLIGLGIWDTEVNHLWATSRIGTRGAIPIPELATFRPWLMEGLEAGGCQPVLLVGARPLWLWRPDLRLSKTHGRIGVMRSRWAVLPMESPERLSKGELTEWSRELRRFTDAINDNRYLEYLPTTCTRCDERVYWYDSDAVPWCREHAEEGTKAQDKGVHKWATEETRSGQQAMFSIGES